MNKKSNVIITMETSVRGGSLSIFIDKKLADFHTGDKTVSNAEDLLPKISELLKNNKINKSEIESIIISNGPGSFTGIRIGIATALALKKSLKCKCYGFDLLKAMTLKAKYETNDFNVISAVSQGRNKICWFDFNNTNLESISENDYFVASSDVLADFIKEKIKNETGFMVCADAEIYNFLNRNLTSDLTSKIKLSNFGDNLSESLIYALNNKFLPGKPRPIYISEKNSAI